jgi:nitrate/TMAO reductase-like tetraheme cytochrome c subunit
MWCTLIASLNLQAQQTTKRQSAVAPPFPYDLLERKINESTRVCDAAARELDRRGIPAGIRSTSSGCPTDTPQRSTTAVVRTVSSQTSVASESVRIRIGDAEQQSLAPRPAAVSIAINDAHAACYDGDPFPSAKKCQACHPGHYREWSVSPHAYAQLSPVFNAMASKLSKLNNGTLGDFCIRCHTPVGIALDEPIVMSNMDRHPAAREGITCVVCHRINQNWGKGSGRQALVAGGLNSPIYGPFGSEVLADVLADPERYGALATDVDPNVRGREVHAEVVPFFALTTSSFCGACHDVFAPNGFRLEDAFSEFKASPAARKKHQGCQDCHMGVSPGEASGYAFEPAAKVGNVWTRPRKRTNHMIAGPDYSIVHPGLFPHNPAAVREEHPEYSDEIETGLATMREWLQFQHRSGWGTEEFESNLPRDYGFPAAWESQARRFRARDILNEQFALLNEATRQRHQVLSAGYKLGDVVLDRAGRDGIRFRVMVFNGTDGHGVPTGFDAERLVFLRASVWDRNGRLVFVSGDLDPNGDVRDSHSFYVHNGELPLDRQLFSLQTRFLTRNVRGGEREQILAVPYSLDPLPYTRPATRPFTVLGRPVGARKHKQNIEANGIRWARYHIKPSQLTGCGPYSAQFELVAGMVPVNLIQEISAVGFDYGMSAREIADAVVAGHMVVDSRTTTFAVAE